MSFNWDTPVAEEVPRHICAAAMTVFPPAESTGEGTKCLSAPQAPQYAQQVPGRSTPVSSSESRGSCVLLKEKRPRGSRGSLPSSPPVDRSHVNESGMLLTTGPQTQLTIAKHEVILP